MKKIISKILIIFIIFIVLFEFILSNNATYALTVSQDMINQITNLAGGIVSIIYWPKRIMAVGLATIINVLTANVASTTGVNYGDAGRLNVITPFDIFFNKYKLLDINFFDINGVAQDTLTYTFRTTVAGWYYIMRLIASVILMVILIYVGIRMALASVAEEKAKYKKMLFDWACSLALIFVLQYIALFVIYGNNAIVNALRETLTDTSVEDGVSSVIMDIALKGVAGIGITSIASTLVFVFIIFQTIAFLIAYINRMIKVGFLIMISPLISITYSIDKMGDGKAQALGTWLKEFVYTILIQPFHCIMYLAFVRTAFTLLVGAQNITILQSLKDIPDLLVNTDYNQLVNGVLAILCLKFINDGEKVVRKIFGFQDDNSTTSMAAGMAVGMMAVKNAKKIATSTRKGINFAKNTGSRLGLAVNQDKNKLMSRFHKDKGNSKNTGNSKTNAKLPKHKESKASKLGNKFKSTSLGGKLSKFSNDHKKLSSAGKSITGYMKRKNSLASTLGLMGAAMAYSTGSTGALEAFGTGSAIRTGSAEFFSSSNGHMANSMVDGDMAEDEKEKEELDNNIAELQRELIDEGVISEDDSEEKIDATTTEHNNNSQNSQRLEILNKAIPELESKENRTPEDDEKLKNMKKEKEDLEKKIPPDIDVKKEKDMADKLTKLKNLKEQRKNFYSLDSITQRLNKRRMGVTNSELQAKKNKIIEKLTELKMQHGKEGDNTENNVLTSDESDNIESVANLLMDNITYGVLTGKGYSTDQQANLVRRALGLNEDLKNGGIGEVLNGATSDFESAQRSIQKSGIYSNQAQYGGLPEDLTDKEAKKIFERSKYLDSAVNSSSRHTT